MTDKTDKGDGKRGRQIQAEFLVGLRGKQVSVTFLDGETLKGELVNFDKWTLFITQESGLEMAVFKHAIKYVCLAAA